MALVSDADAAQRLIAKLHSEREASQLLQAGASSPFGGGSASSLMACMSRRTAGQRYLPISPGENLTEPGLMSVSVSLIKVDILSTVNVNCVNASSPGAGTQT